MKPYIGKTAYTLSLLPELVKRTLFKFDFELDGGKVNLPNQDVFFLQIYNGKYGGGRIMLNPIGLINDGFMEFVYYEGR
jgi:diacylglycerol kinase family enzyme